LAVAVSLGVSAPALAQATSGMDHRSMPDMDMSGDKPGTTPPPMDGMTMDHGAMYDMPRNGTDLPAGHAPAPAPPTDRYATRIFPAAEIERSHRQMMNESGAQTFGFVMFNLAEYQPRRGRDGFRWDGEGWYGGDIDRLTIKTEGEGGFGEGVDGAEVQALYSRAIDPYFNAQVGVRQDLGRGARRTYATVGFEGLAPYWFEVEGALFLSDKGDVLGRLEGYYDQRISQRLILQPRVEFNLSAQDVPASRIGAGLSTAEVGLRLRYEIKRQFAPYVGVSWERKVGQTGRYARADGDDVESKGVVAGIRFWF
jgi:copper resistance protein B